MVNRIAISDRECIHEILGRVDTTQAVEGRRKILGFSIPVGGDRTAPDDLPKVESISRCDIGFIDLLFQIEQCPLGSRPAVPLMASNKTAASSAARAHKVISFCGLKAGLAANRATLERSASTWRPVIRC